MKYRTHVEDFFPEKAYRLTNTPEAKDFIRSVLWSRVRSRYKKRPKFWDEIYLRVRDDLMENYDVECLIALKRKEED